MTARARAHTHTHIYIYIKELVTSGFIAHDRSFKFIESTTR